MKKILHIDASGRGQDSVSRKLSREIVSKLNIHNDQVIYRDVSQGLPFVDEQMIGSYFSPKSDRTAQQIKAIAVSDQVVSELKQSDIVVVGVPIYNFSMPAGFKAWCDLAARVGETFRYTESGPAGLLEGKKAYVAIATGGTGIDSEIDFLTPWLRHYFGFIGIKEVEIIKADRLNKDAAVVLKRAQQLVSTL